MKKLFFVLLIILCGLTFNVKAQYITIRATFYSEALDEVKKVNVYLPSDYYEHPEIQYAVIYYLHGAGGNQNEGGLKATWYYYFHAQDTSITSPPAILVCPDGSCEPYAGSDYVNSELYGNYADYTTIDVIEFAETNFRVNPSREFRFVCGTSMGGFGSALHSLNDPELFRASFPFIGFPAVTEDFFTLWKGLVYEENGSYTDISYSAGVNRNQYDASNKVRDIPPDNNLTFYLGCGLTDYMGTYPLYLQFMDSLDFYGIPYQYNFFDGGHEDDPETWEKGFHWMDSIINHSFLTMGVETVQTESELVSVYPNPVHNTLHISWLSINTAPATITIYNQTGQKIVNKDLLKTCAGTNEVTIDVSQLQSGIYILQMMLDGKMVTKRFVKY